MAALPRPADYPDWATDAGHKTAPAAGRVAAGWVPGYRVPGYIVNWLENLVGQWVRVFDDWFETRIPRTGYYPLSVAHTAFSVDTVLTEESLLPWSPASGLTLACLDGDMLLITHCTKMIPSGESSTITSLAQIVSEDITILASTQPTDFSYGVFPSPAGAPFLSTFLRYDVTASEDLLVQGVTTSSGVSNQISGGSQIIVQHLRPMPGAL